MIQAVSDTCSIRWTKVNHKVYKFQSLVFNDDEKQIEEIEPVNNISPTPPSPSNAVNDTEKQLTVTTQNTSHSEQDSACHGHSKITGPIQWKQVYGEYLGKESDVLPVIQESPKGSRKSFESPPKIARKSPESPLMRQRKDVQVIRFDNENCLKKDQRRVHFEDDVKIDDDDDDVFENEQTKKSCLPDCALCRSIVSRDFSPPYQALVDKSMLQPRT